MNWTDKVLLRPHRVADLLDISIRQVYRLLEQGQLKGHNDNPGHRGLRITSISVKNYIEMHSQ
jgi:hypothetical protein